MHLNLFGKIVKEEWLKSEKIRREVTLDSFIIMPNHLHGIVVINQVDNEINTKQNKHAPVETHGGVSLINNSTNTKTHSRASLQENTLNEKQYLSRSPKSISSFMAGFKSVTTKKINYYRKTPNQPVWQSSFHDSIIKSQKYLDTVRYYIHINPLKWHLDRNNPENHNGWMNVKLDET